MWFKHNVTVNEINENSNFWYYPGDVIVHETSKDWFLLLEQLLSDGHYATWNVLVLSSLDESSIGRQEFFQFVVGKQLPNIFSVIRASDP